MGSTLEDKMAFFPGFGQGRAQNGIIPFIDPKYRGNSDNIYATVAYAVPQQEFGYQMAVGNPGGLPNNNLNIQPIQKPNTIIIGANGGLHDTLSFDRYNNMYNNHTTVQIPGGKTIRMPFGDQYR